MLLLNVYQLFIFGVEGTEPGYFEKERKPGDSVWSSGGMGWERGFGEGLRAKKKGAGFPGGAVVKNLPANAGDPGSSPGPGRSHTPRSS